MTRRVVNPDILPQITEMRVLPNGLCQYKDPYIGKWYDSGTRSQPKYKVGEVVAVAQAYRDIIPYIADSFYQPSPDFMKDNPGYNNKMFVRADLMPHQIRILSVRVERLQDINDEDCLREGIWKMTFDTFSFDSWKFFVHNPREAFAALIDKVSGKDTFESNPWVFVYKFELVK